MGRLYIYLHLAIKFKPNVGKYTSHMDPMGMKHTPRKTNMFFWESMLGFDVTFPIEKPSLFRGHYGHSFVFGECRDNWMITFLGVGFQYFWFSPLFGEDSHFDSYFSGGLKPPTSTSFLSQSTSCLGYLDFSSYIWWPLVFEYMMCPARFWQSHWHQSRETSEHLTTPVNEHFAIESPHLFLGKYHTKWCIFQPAYVKLTPGTNFPRHFVVTENGIPWPP